MKKWIFGAAFIAEVVVASVMPSIANADELNNVIRVGYADIGTKGSSTDLAGPPGTTPPGIGASVKDLKTLGISYERKFSPNWSVQFQGGVPPTVTAVGTGAGSAVGDVVKARIWFPSVLAIYTFNDVPVIRPYIGAGLTYTFFSDAKVSAGYTAAFGGSSSSAELSGSLAPTVRIGAEYPLDDRWSLRMEYTTYRLKSTATVVTQTPGLGAIPRTTDITSNPRIFGISLGYKF